MATELAGRYDLLEELGRGASAVVHRARDRKLGIDVAVKLLAPHLGTDPAAVARLRREVQAARRIASDAVAQVYDLGEEEGRPFVVMEYGPSGTLKDHLLLNGPLAMPALDRVVEQLAEALVACHARGILHRDLKPSNVLYDPGAGRIKLIDFGVACMADSGDPELVGSIVGTPEYMAPEQFEDGVPDPRSDLYAAGAVLYEAATGRPPVTGRTLPEVVRRHQQGAVAAPRTLNPGLGPGTEGIILRLLARDPAERFQSAEELLRAVRGEPVPEATIAAPMVGRCPVCAEANDASLPLCAMCGGDLAGFRRFGRWSVEASGAVDAAEIDHALDDCLPGGAVRVARRRPYRAPLTVLDFAAEPLARHVAGELKRRGIAASARLLRLPKIVAVGLFLAVAARFLVELAVSSYVSLVETAAYLDRSQWRYPETAADGLGTPVLLLLASSGFLALLLTASSRHLWRRFGRSLAYVPPVARATAAASPVLRACERQRRLRTRRLRAIGRDLIVSAQRQSEAGRGADAAIGPAPGRLLDAACDVLAAMDLQFAALAARGEPREARLQRQDCLLRATQALLRLAALWRRRAATLIQGAAQRLGEQAAALAAEHEATGRARDDLLHVLRELEAVGDLPEPAHRS